MSDLGSSKLDSRQLAIFEVKIKGHISQQWAEWFEDMEITLVADGYTILIGRVVDDAALHGLLKRVRDLGMSLISVNRIEPDQTNVDGAPQ